MSDTTRDELDINLLDLHDADFDLTPIPKPTIFPVNTVDPCAPLHAAPTESPALLD